MAINRELNHPWVVNTEFVEMIQGWLMAGTGDPTVISSAAVLFDAARIGVGHYRLTWRPYGNDGLPNIITKEVSVSTSDGKQILVTFGAIDTSVPSSPTLDIYTYDLSVGMIDFPLASARALAAGQTQVLAAVAYGLLGQDSVPKLTIANPGTDNHLLIEQTNANSASLMWACSVPLDMSATDSPVVMIKTANSSSGGSNTIGVGVYNNNVNLGGTTSAITLATAVTKSITLSASPASTIDDRIVLILNPGTVDAAHSNYLLNVKMSYTKKVPYDVTANASNSLSVKVGVSNSSVP